MYSKKAQEAAEAHCQSKALFATRMQDLLNWGSITLTAFGYATAAHVANLSKGRPVVRTSATIIAGLQATSLALSGYFMWQTRSMEINGLERTVDFPFIDGDVRVTPARWHLACNKHGVLTGTVEDPIVHLRTRTTIKFDTTGLPLTEERSEIN